MTDVMSPVRGGAWLVDSTDADAVTTPERLTDEHRLIEQAADEFITKDVMPALEALERKDWSVARALLRRSGELGFLGTDVPEEYGGVGLDKVSSIVLGEVVGWAASFATTFGAQTGLTMTPLLCFGSEAQKHRYLPRLVTGELVGAYCLSESGSGSDALSARTRATRQPDGSWVLSGEKMWITNGGFADIFIVFAKVDGEQFSAFIVERAFPGVSSGKEEHKMGLHGSSTTPVLLADARVPAENLLGEIGKGHKIAFNVLNYGRLKLASMCTGGAKFTIAEAAKYAASRRQFGQPIAAFGAIRHKLAEMTIRAFGVESALFRTTGAIDAWIAASDSTGADASKITAAALEEFALDASLLKVAGTEMLDYVVDENVQIHGGNGFVRDYPAEGHYRDARVNRIFEGTNEINRLLVPGLLIKRSLKGGPNVLAAAAALQEQLLVPTPAAAETDDPLENARRTVDGIRKTAVLAIGLAARTHGEKLGNEQEVLMLLADIVQAAFIAESAVLRAEQQARRTPGAATAATPQLMTDAASVLAHDAGLAAEAAARTVVAALTAGDTRRTMLAALRRVLKVAPVDTVAARRRIAGAVIERTQYVFA